MKKLALGFPLLCLATLAGCTRIPTGEIGLRTNMSNEIQMVELQPGTWNQTIIGSVMKFPVREIAVNVTNKQPLTADNSALADFDVTVVYSINPASVAELYSTKSRSFHSQDEETDEILLMHTYLETLIFNASVKSVRQFKSLEVADNRQRIEADIREHLIGELKQEKLDLALTISAVQIRAATPNQAILDSATQYVKAQNELRIKETEVEIAKKESERMVALAANSGQSIAYMAAQANMLIAQGIREGRVQTIVVPVDFRGMINVGKP